MYRKFVLTIAIVSSLFVCQLAGAATSDKANHDKAKTVAPAVKTTQQPAAKTTVKPTQSEDEKYAQVYEKCTKEAEANEPKYDQLFNTCMEKNGFPQEEFETGGMPIPSGDQDN